LPGLSCSDSGFAGDGDAMVSFEISSPGMLRVDYDHSGGDLQYALFADDGACSEALCYNLFPVEVGYFSAQVNAGRYFLVVEAWQGGDEAPSDLIIYAP